MLTTNHAHPTQYFLSHLPAVKFNNVQRDSFRHMLQIHMLTPVSHIKIGNPATGEIKNAALQQ